MNEAVLARFKRAFSLRRNQLLAWTREAEVEKVVRLGGCAEDEICVVRKLDHALQCIEDGSFGQCAECSGEVELDRLQLDFTTQVCLDHYSAEELRGLERELELAADVQRRLLPGFVPAMQDIEISAHARPARIVGGDYYDFFTFGDEAQGITIADVMGKGLSASLMMSSLQASLRILGPQIDSPHALASRLNELLRYNVAVPAFVSMFLLAIDPDEKGIAYCNAGHHPGILWKHAKRDTESLAPTGPAVGLVHEPRFETLRTAFAPGDVVVLYTDGLVEARDEEGREFGLDRLRDLVVENHDRPVRELVDTLREAVVRFANGKLLDDTTIVAMQHT